MQRVYIVLCKDGYCKRQYSCMNYMEMDFISVHRITDPKSNLVIVICHTVMCRSYLSKDSTFLLLPLTVIWKFSIIMQKTFQTQKLMTIAIIVIYAFHSPKPLKHQ